MKTTRKSHVINTKVIEVMITVAMIFVILTGVVPGTSFKVNAAGTHLSVYSADEALNTGALKWDESGDTEFTLVLKAGGYTNSGLYVESDDYEDDFTVITIYDDGKMVAGNNCYYAYDANLGCDSNCWYVDSIDVAAKTITLTGSAPTM